jgi:hypothetical protein
VQLEGVVQLKNLMTYSVIEPTTFLAYSIMPQSTTLPRALLNSVLASIKQEGKSLGCIVTYVFNFLLIAQLLYSAQEV